MVFTSESFINREDAMSSPFTDEKVIRKTGPNQKVQVKDSLNIHGSNS